MAVLAVAFVLLQRPGAAAADPVRLKLAYFGSEQALTYQAGVKPFVDAINAEGRDLIAIDVYADGVLGKSLAEQPALLQKNAADFAWVVPGQTPYRFPDLQIFELPWLDAREGTLAYTHLVDAGLLRGYDDFVVIGAYTTGPTFFHSRKPIGSLAALHGLKVRANNASEAEVLGRLNAIATVMPVSQVAAAFERNTIDAALVGLTGAADFGIADVATHHYLLAAGTAPVALLMNRRSFDRLSDEAKGLIRKYSGEWTAKAWIERLAQSDQSSLDRLRRDPRQTVVDPSAGDQATANSIFHGMIETWAAGGERNRALLSRLEAELAEIRSAARQ
ncbi:MAG: TRAP transporter substrate-binding protein [Pseudolabrys sp.]